MGKERTGPVVDDAPASPLAAIVDATRSVASQIAPPPQPVDGDCLEWAPHVTEKLAAAGLDARLGVLVGKTEFLGREVVGFFHQVTLTGHDQVVTDLTARQFNRTLPACWVAPFADYATTLAKAAGCTVVEILEGV